MIVKTVMDKGSKEHNDFRSKLIDINIIYEDEDGVQKTINNDNILDFFTVQLYFNKKDRKTEE